MTPWQDIEAETVILVVADSLRADVADSELDYLGRLADDYAKYEAAFAPGASTPSSMPGIVQSRLPIDHRGYGLTLPPEIPTLAEALASYDVKCAAWHSNVYVGAEHGFDRGFDTYSDVLHGDRNGSGDQLTGNESSWRDVMRELTNSLGVRKQAERVFERFKRYGIVDANPKVPADRLVDICLGWLPDRPDHNRRFAWLHLMDTHLPYFPSKSHRRQANAPVSSRIVYDLWKRLIEEPESLTDNDVEQLRRLYVGEGKYIDSQIRWLVEELHERGLWEDAVIVFTADHGELFRDREVPYEVNLKHPDYLCEELTHVPLVIAGGAIPDRSSSRLASGLDLAPTIAELFSVERPDEWIGTVLDGPSFQDRKRIVSALAHTYGGGTGARVERDAVHVGIRTQERALLWWLDNSPSTEYYRRTPDGEVEILAEEVGDGFEAEIDIAEQCANQYVDVRGRGESGGQVSQRLKDLGYVE